MKILKNFLKKLANYPRLRVLLLIVLIVVIMILVANVLGGGQKNVSPFPGSELQHPEGQSRAAFESKTTQEYQALAAEARQREIQQKISAGQSLVPTTLPTPAKVNPEYDYTPAKITDASSTSPGPAQRSSGGAASLQSTPVQAIQSPQLPDSNSVDGSASRPSSVSSQTSMNKPGTDMSSNASASSGLNYAELVKEAQSRESASTNTAIQPVSPSNPQETAQPVAMNSSNPSSPNQQTPQASSSQGTANGSAQAEMALRRALLMREPLQADRDRGALRAGVDPEAINALTQQMQSQMGSLSSHWDFHPMSSVTLPEAPAPKSTEQQPSSVAITAGTVYYGVLLTAVDSDQPSAPIMAKVVSGPYEGAKLLGGFKLEGERLVVNFTSMTLPHMDHSIGISAYAIDGVTAQNALASNVDHHYMYRYGSLFAAAFLEGFGDAYSNWNPCAYGVTTCTIVGNDIAPPPTTTKQAIYRGVGQVGTTLGQQVAQNFNRPPTVTLNQGIGIGVLFMQDVKV